MHIVFSLKSNMKGLYIHIPFCKTICSYCDFTKQIPFKNIEEVYIKALIKEIEDKKNLLTDITSVYIGGGTPNSLSLALLERLFMTLKPYLDTSLENSIELNPELVNESLAILLHKYNINRVSLGVQTVNVGLLKLLNRYHSKDIVINSYNIINKYIKNINIDLMFGIPGESFKEIDENINLIKLLKPTHISYYSLILEEKTILNHRLLKNEIKLLDDDLIADMNEYINKNLESLGYIHYETSNYAKEGFTSSHNLLYWSMSEYVGCGASACGFINDTRYKNHDSLTKYLNSYLESEEVVSFKEKRNEFMFLGLRKLAGIDILVYNEMFKGNPIKDYHLEDLIEQGFLEIDNNMLRIKKDKIFVSNQVLIRFVGDED